MSTTQAPSVVVDLRDGELASGTMVGEYRIEQKLGQGGMGVVYAAVHPIIGKRAAVKVVCDAMAHNPEAVQRFVQEAQAVNQIAHPNIVDIFSFGALPDGRPYFVMELLRGENLAQRLARGRLPLAESLEILGQICRALEATHRQGIIHRDLKPENVFIDDRGDKHTIKLLDFGIAKLVRTESGKVNLTQDGMAMGTPTYASPELARARPVDGRSDVYSLGVMAFEMFVGRVPFTADNALDLLLMHVTRPPPEATSVWPDLPDSLNALLLRMMAKEAEARPSLEEVRKVFGSQSLSALATPPEPDLTTRPVVLRAGTDVVSPLSEPMAAVRRRWVKPAVALLGCAALGLVGLMLTRHDATKDEVAAQPVAPVASPPKPEPAPAPTPAPTVDKPAEEASTNRASDARWGEARRALPDEGGRERPPLIDRAAKHRAHAPRPSKPTEPAHPTQPVQSPRPARPVSDDGDGAMNPYAK